MKIQLWKTIPPGRSLGGGRVTYIGGVEVLPVPAACTATTTACAALATATTATTTEAATTTATAARLLARLGLVYAQIPSLMWLLVQRLNSSSTFLGVGHLNKGEPSRAPGIPIRDDVDLGDLAIWLKELAKFILSRLIRQIPDIDSHLDASFPTTEILDTNAL